MFRYLEQVRRDRPQFRVDYVDWIVHNTARALGEDPTEVKAALLGFSHHHEHSAAQQRNIVESGCARGGDISAQEKDALAEEHDMDAHDETATVRFAINDLSTRSDLAFQVTESGAVFTDYGVSHEKEMHLLIVRDDLRHFSHVHPERDADGTWRVPFTPSAGGTYWFYADFVDSDIAHYTMRFERTYASDTGNYGFIENGTDVRRVGNYNVILEKTPYSDGTLFTYHIDDDSGDPPLLEAYLGEMAHGVLISPSGRFIHTHPSWAGDHIVLHLPKAPEETYRVFMQFQVQGEVITSEFDWVHEHAQH